MWFNAFKKFIGLTLVFAYLFSMNGLSIKLHHCGGRITSVKFNFDDAHHCKCDKKLMSKNCCKNEAKFLKLNENHEISSSSFAPFEQVGVLYSYSLYTAPVYFISKSEWKPTSHSPPDIYLLNRSIRI